MNNEIILSPNHVPPFLHNILMILLILSLGMWMLRIFRKIVLLITMKASLHYNRIVRVDFGGDKLIGAKDLEEFLRKTMELPSQQIKFIKNNVHLETEKMSLIKFSQSNKEECKLTLDFHLEEILDQDEEEEIDVKAMVIWGIKKSLVIEHFDKINKKTQDFEQFMNIISMYEGNEIIATSKGDLIPHEGKYEEKYRKILKICDDHTEFKMNHSDWESMTSLGRLESDDKTVQRFPLTLIIDYNSKKNGRVYLFMVFNFVENGKEEQTLSGYKKYYNAIELEKFVSTNERVVELFDVFEVDKEESECIVCYAENKNTILLPCRHICVGKYCLSKLDKCPICRKKISSFLTLSPKSVN